MKDILDGHYVGELNPQEVILQYEYRAGIHLSYINRIEEQPDRGWEAYGTKEWHRWAINGYEEGIRHLEDYIAGNVTTIYRCNLGQAFLTIITALPRFFMRLFRR